MTNSTDRKPNFLFIMSDQHRYDYVGCAGASFLHTPNLDRLAASGTRFTQCCTNCPVCAPARIGLASGVQPFRLGSLDNHSFLPRSVPTYYQALRDHGYRVGCTGKLDLAKPDHYNGRFGDRPCVYGWGFTHPEECEGKMHAGSFPHPVGPYTHYLENRNLLQEFYEDYRARASKGWIVGASHDSVLPADAFEDIYIGGRAAEWIEQIPDDFPWHFFVSFVGPHDPFDPPTEYAERYRRASVPAAIEDDLGGKPAWIRNRRTKITPEEIAVTRRQYCGSIQAIDDQIGGILQALETRGVVENTYIVYSSDHGEMLGDHGLYTKSVGYEAALRVPLIVSGPGIAGNAVSDALVELIDLHPTLLELAGVPVPENLDARSLVPVLRGKTSKHRSEVISTIRNFRCIRTHTHKLIQSYNDIAELYDLENDPEEKHNRADEDKDTAHALGKRMRERHVEGKWLH